jgi:hypothetical protein
MPTAFFGSAGPAAAPARPASDPQPVHEEIRLELLSDTQWRVCDSRWSEYDARSLVGFIEKRDELFEVMQLDHGFERFTFTTLVEAIAHFVNVRLQSLPDDEKVPPRLRTHA